MVAHVKTVAFEGVETTDVDVQVQIAPGLPAFTVVGLPDKAVAESRERVRAAIHALGLSLPPKKIIVNFAPADLIKEGSHFDLPIAIAVLVAMQVLAQDEVDRYLALGELGLDGALLSVSGILPAGIAANTKEMGIVCPQACGPEALWAGDIEVLAPANLLALINHFKGLQVLSQPEKALVEARRNMPDMKDIRGQETARRALEVPAIDTLDMLGRAQGEPSAAIAARVAAARVRQKERFDALGVPFRTNADVTGELLQHFAPEREDAKTLLEQATESFRPSMRGYTRVLRVARTIADLEGSPTVEKHHIAEAVSFRQAPLMQAAKVA
jgi:predicted ATPase with chaperone activity